MGRSTFEAYPRLDPVKETWQQLLAAIEEPDTARGSGADHYPPQSLGFCLIGARKKPCLLYTSDAADE